METLEEKLKTPVPIPEMIPSYIKLVTNAVYFKIPEYQEVMREFQSQIKKERDSRLRAYLEEYLRLSYAGASEIWDTYISQSRELSELKNEYSRNISRITQEYSSRLKAWSAVTSWNESGLMYRIVMAVATYLAAQPVLGDLALTVSIGFSAAFEGVVRLLRKRWRKKIEDWFCVERDKVISEYDSKYQIISENYKKRRREKYIRYVKLASEAYKKLIDKNYRLNTNLVNEVATASLPPFTHEGKVGLASDHYLNHRAQSKISPVV